jgi:hypothetical protein
MSYNTKMDTITVNDVTYDVERQTSGGYPIHEYLTLAVDGEPVFEGLKGAIGYDEDGGGMSPRDWCNVGTMSVSYRGYDLGDEDISKLDFEIECPNCEGNGEDPSGTWVVGVHYSAERLAVGSEEECQSYLNALPDVETGKYYIEPFGCKVCDAAGVVDVNPAEYFIRNEGARVVIGLFVYEHSGITMSAGPRVGEVLKQSDVRSTGRFIGDDAGWDTSFVGFIYDTPEGVKQCFGDDATDEQIEKALRSEVEVYGSYLEGDITFWYVEDDETGFHEACGGYVGDHEYCEQECFSNMESAIEKRLSEMQERADMAARDIITKG